MQIKYSMLIQIEKFIQVTLKPHKYPVIISLEDNQSQNPRSKYPSFFYGTMSEVLGLWVKPS